MKIQLTRLLLALCIISLMFFSGTTQAQNGECLAGSCPINNFPYGGPFTTTSNTFAIFENCNYSGDYILYSVTSGETYEWSLCIADGAHHDDPTSDTKMTLRDGNTLLPICYSDDYCGIHAKIRWTATFTGNVEINLNDAFCGDLGGNCIGIAWRCVSCVTYDPCAVITTIPDCNVLQTVNFGGTGVWNVNSCGFLTPGMERIYQFTATQTGVHQIQVTATTGFEYVDYFWKPASGGCNNTGWTCVDQTPNGVVTPATIGSLNFVAGTTYYFLMDPEGTTTHSHTFQVLCPTVANPCLSVTTLTGCGNSVTTSHSGTGAWNTTFCGNNTFGLERIYQITAPITGEYTIDVLSATGGTIDYFWKDASLGCNNTGWNCIGDISIPGIYNGSQPMNFVVGNTYYILLDPQSNTVYSHTFSVRCPVPADPTSITATVDTFCNGGGTTMTAAGSVGVVYWYTGSCGGTLLATGNPFSQTPTVTTTYYARNYNGFHYSAGCATKEIVVEQNILNTSIASNQSVCANNLPLLLTGVQPSGGNGNYLYQWESSTNNSSWALIPSGNADSHQPPLLSQNTYFRRVVSAGYCTPTTSASVAIESVPNVVPAVTISANTGTIICQGDNVTFTANPVNGGSPPGYQWYLNANLVLGETNATFQTSTLNDNDQVDLVMFSNAICPNPSSLSSNAITMQVKPVPTLPLITHNSPVCEGSALGFSADFAPSVSYAWTGPNSFTSSSQNNLIPAVTQFYSGVYSVTTTLNGCTSQVATVNLSVELPIGTTTLSAAQTICSGTAPNALTSTLPTGGSGPYTYTWQSSTNNLSWNLGVSGSTQVFSPGVLNISTYYRVVISSGVCTPASSPGLLITVDQSISNNILNSSQSLCGSGVAQIITGSIPVGGSGSYTFGWQSSTDNTNWTIIPGEVALNYNPGFVSSNVYFRRTVSGGLCPPSTSASLSIRVDPAIGTNTILTNQTICSGNIPPMISGSTPIGGDGTYLYVWESSLDGSSWVNIPGNNTLNYSEGSLTITAYYRRNVFSSGCQNVSGHVIITVVPGVTNNIIGSNQTLCQGTPSALITGSIPSGGDGSYSYIWESSSDNSNWGVIPGANGLSYNAGTLNTTLHFRRLVTSGICPPFTSNSVNIIIQNPLTNNLTGVDQVLCLPSTANTLTGSIPSGGNGVYTFVWESSSNTSLWVTMGSEVFQNYTPPGPASTTYYRRVVSSGVCNPVTSAMVSIIVHPQLSNFQIGSNQTICSGSTTSMLIGSVPNGGDGNYNYVWESSSDNSNWNIIIGQNAVNYNAGVLTSNTYFRRNVSSAACSETSTTVTIRVDQPVGNNSVTSNQTICSAFVPSLLVGSSPNGGTGTYTYTWQTSPNNINWFNISDGSLNNYQPFALNTTTYYRRTVSSGICNPSTSNGIQVIVTPVPTAHITSPGILCTGTPTQVSISLGGQAPWDFTWTDGTNSTPVNGYMSNQYIINITPTFSQTFSISSLFSVCNGTITGNGDVTVTPIPNASLSGSQIICSGSNANISVNFTGTGPWDFSWTDGAQTNTINGASVNPYVFSVTPSGTRTYTLTSLFSGCTGTVSGSSVVNVYAPPGAFISANQTICQGTGTNLSVNFNGIAPWNIVYTDGTSNFPVNGINFNPYTFPVNPVSSTTYSLVSVNNGCAGVVAGIAEIDVRPAPSAMLSGGTSICQGDSARLTVNLTGVGPWTITYSDGTNVATRTGILNSPFTFAVTPSTTRTYSLTNVFATCFGSVSGSAAINVTAPSIGFLSGNATVCQGEASNIQVGLSGSSPWSITYTNGTVPVTVNGITSSPYVFSVTPSQTQQYSLLSVNSVCPGTSSGTATVVVNPVPTATMSGTIPTCSGNQAQVSIFLTGVQPYSVTYTNGVTPTTINNISSSPYVFAVNPLVSTTYTVTQVSTTCAGTVSGSTVVVPEAPPTASLSGSQTTCVSSGAALTVNFTGSGPYNIVYTDGTNNFNANGLTQNPALVAVNPGVQQRTYTLVSVTGGCSGTVSGSQTIYVEPKPIASLSAPSGLCTGAGTLFTVNLSGTGPWNITYTDGSSSYAENGITASPHVWSLNPAVTSTWNLVNVSGLYCTGNVMPATSVVHVSVPPTVTFTGGATICGGNQVALSINPTGQAPFTFTYTDGTNITSITGIMGDTSIWVSPADTITYTAVSISSLGCADLSNDQVLVDVIPAPSMAVTGADQTICTSNSSISATPLTIGNGQWTVVSGSGTITDPTQAITSITGLSVGTNVLMWTTQNAGCFSNDQLIIDVSLPPTSANAGTDQNVCGTSTILNANTPLNGTGIWTVISGNANIIDVNNPNSLVIGLGTGQTTLMWTITSGICTSTSTMSIFASPSAPSANAGPDQLICSSSTVLTANNPGMSPGLWTLVSGNPAVINNPNASQTQVSGLILGTYTFVWSVYSGGCFNSDTIQVQVVAQPVANFSFIQFGFSADFTNLSQGNPTSFNWSFGDGGVSNLQNPQYTYLQAGLYNVRLIVTNSCSSDTIIRNLRIFGVNAEDDISNTWDISLYPNPADEGYMILKAFNLNGDADEIHFVLRSITGAEVYSKRIPLSGYSEIEYRIVPEVLLPKGTYLAEITYGNSTRVLKQIIR